MSIEKIKVITGGRCDTCHAGRLKTKTTGHKKTSIMIGFKLYQCVIGKTRGKSCEHYTPKKFILAKAVINKIKTQFDLENIEHKLLFGVIYVSITDSIIPKYEHDAKKYLKSDMPHAEICGVSADWIRAVYIKSGLTL